MKQTKEPISQSAFLSRIRELRQSKETAGVDLSTAEDLSLAVMNLISLEEHFFFTAMKTGKDEYLGKANEVRTVRKELLQKLLPEHEGETWCASKHLLAATMRLIEVGNKLQSEKQEAGAKEMFSKAYEIYSVFWALKLKLVGVSALKDEAKDATSFEHLMNELANCCNE